MSDAVGIYPAKPLEINTDYSITFQSSDVKDLCAATMDLSGEPLTKQGWTFPMSDTRIFHTSKVRIGIPQVNPGEHFKMNTNPLYLFIESPGVDLSNVIPSLTIQNIPGSGTAYVTGIQNPYIEGYARFGMPGSGKVNIRISPSQDNDYILVDFLNLPKKVEFAGIDDIAPLLTALLPHGDYGPSAVVSVLGYPLFVVPSAPSTQTGGEFPWWGWEYELQNIRVRFLNSYVTTRNITPLGKGAMVIHLDGNIWMKAYFDVRFLGIPLAYIDWTGYVYNFIFEVYLTPYFASSLGEIQSSPWGDFYPLYRNLQFSIYPDLNVWVDLQATEISKFYNVSEEDFITRLEEQKINLIGGVGSSLSDLEPIINNYLVPVILNGRAEVTYLDNDGVTRSTGFVSELLERNHCENSVNPFLAHYDRNDIIPFVHYTKDPDMSLPVIIKNGKVVTYFIDCLDFYTGGQNF